MYTEQALRHKSLALVEDMVFHALMLRVKSCLREMERYEKGKYNPDQPRVPAGSSDGGQWASGGGGGGSRARESVLIGGEGNDTLGQAEVAESWGNPDTLARHVKDHGSDFNLTSGEEYVRHAEEFRLRAIQEKLPAVEYPKGGKIAIYDPATNTFGLYNRNGTTASYYKPRDSVAYFQKLRDRQVARGGRVINPLSRSAEGGGGGGALDILHPHHSPLSLLDIEE
jgi:hypothetical protein